MRRPRPAQGSGFGLRASRLNRAALPGRGGWPVGLAASEASAGSSGPKVVWGDLREPPHTEERPRGGSAPGGREAARAQRGLVPGAGCPPGAHGLLRSARGLRGGRWEPRPRMRRPRPRAAGSWEATSRARGWGGARAAWWTLARAHGVATRR